MKVTIERVPIQVFTGTGYVSGRGRVIFPMPILLLASR